MTSNLHKIIFAYWRNWQIDTAEIAQRVGVDESKVYNALARAREQERAG